MLSQSFNFSQFLSMPDEEYIKNIRKELFDLKKKMLDLQHDYDRLQIELKKEQLMERNELVAGVPLWAINGDKE